MRQRQSALWISHCSKTKLIYFDSLDSHLVALQNNFPWKSPCTNSVQWLTMIYGPIWLHNHTSLRPPDVQDRDRMGTDVINGPVLRHSILKHAVKFAQNQLMLKVGGVPCNPASPPKSKSVFKYFSKMCFLAQQSQCFQTLMYIFFCPTITMSSNSTVRFFCPQRYVSLPL